MDRKQNSGTTVDEIGMGCKQKMGLKSKETVRED